MIPREETMKERRKALLFWGVSLVLTLLIASYQRLSGPTRPLRGQLDLGGKRLYYKLPRSCDRSRQCKILVETPSPEAQGRLLFRRYKASQGWSEREMSLLDGRLEATLPPQPPAGKVEYRLMVRMRETRSETIRGSLMLFPEKPVVLRFKGRVSPWLLVPHILFIFLSLLFSVRTFLETFAEGSGKLEPYLLLTLGTLLLGGLVFGPLVQLSAFGALWTGFPLGSDLTDTKTLLAFLAWGAAWLKVHRDPEGGKKWVKAVFLLTTLVFLVPHSLLGSEFRYPSGMGR